AEGQPHPRLPVTGQQAEPMATGTTSAPAQDERRRASSGKVSFLASQRGRELTLIWLFLLPSLAIFALYRIIPMIWNVVLSLEFWSPYKPATFAGLYHYQEMLFYDDAFWEVVWNTILFMISAPVGIALA